MDLARRSHYNSDVEFVTPIRLMTRQAVDRGKRQRSIRQPSRCPKPRCSEEGSIPRIAVPDAFTPHAGMPMTGMSKVRRLSAHAG